MFKPSFLSALLSFGMIYHGVEAASKQHYAPVARYAGVKEKKDLSCPQGPRPMRIGLRHIESNGIGYNQGYTTLEGFFALTNPVKTSWVPFLDLRGHIFNDGKLASNAGIGVRHLSSRVWGANVYYDYRNTRRQHYNQVGMGLESLGQRWDFRLNGYLPVGDKRSPHYHTRFDHFEGHYAILSRKYQYALSGADFEVGTHVNLWAKPWYFAESVYYLNGQGKSTWGGQVRASIALSEYFRVEANTSYDSLFKWIGQGQVSVILPFGQRRTMQKTKSTSCSLAARAFQDVGRHEIIPVATKHIQTKAISPITEEPIVFWFVDNTRLSSEGTFEHRFPTLGDAQDSSDPYDVIYVFPGDNTATGMNEGIVLKNGQQLLGSGTIHPLKTAQGTVTIPTFSTLFPLLGNLEGSVVTIANNNVISGLWINNLNGPGITQPNSGISVENLTITKNVIFGADDTNSINLNNVGGSVKISYNKLGQASTNLAFVNDSIHNASYLIAHNFIMGNANSGNIEFDFTNCTGIETKISKNTMHALDELITGNLINTDPGNPNIFNIFSNYCSCDETAINFLLNSAANAVISLKSNKIYCSDADGLDVTANATSTCSLLVENNEFYTWTAGISVAGNQSSSIESQIIGNNITSKLEAAIDYFIQDQATSVNTISYNQAVTDFSSSAPAIFVRNQSESDSTFVISENVAASSTREAFGFLNEGSAPGLLKATVTGNRSVVGFDGIFIRNTSGASSFTIADNFFNGNADVAALIIVDDGSLCLQFHNNLSNPVEYTNGNIPYQFLQTGGVFSLGPISSNFGEFSFMGSFTDIGPDDCP